MCTRKKKRIILGYFSFILLLLSLVGCNTSVQANNTEVTSSESNLKVHFIDVGQADSAFIELPNQQTMLIDAGNNNDEELVVDYIKNLGYTRIDYAIGTHPHEDHIGGLDNVIDCLDIGKIYFPAIPDKDSPTTKTYESVVRSIQNKNLKITAAKAGNSILSSDNLNAEILSPASSSYENLNNYSVVIKLTYGNTSFLFTGDMESDVESELSGNLKADVLKVGHHGSDTSTSDAFLEKVSPDIAVISVGANNKYGHPVQSTLDKLNQAGIQIYRTDELGSITILSDGNTISADKQAKPITSSIPNQSSVSNQPQPKDTIVYVTESGKSYHLETCHYVKNKKIALPLSEAKANYKPCSKCQPPE